MAMRTESGTRLAAWLVVPLAGAGAVLGLWQVGAFDRPAAPASAAFNDGGVDRSSPWRTDTGVVATPAGPGRSNATATDVASPGPATHLQQLDSMADPDEQAESTARLEALAAEQASEP